MAKKKLEDCNVEKMDPKLFAIKEPVYRFNLRDKDTIPLMEVPHGSLIFLNRTIPTPSGFNLAVCGIWKGENNITERRKIVMRKVKK